jgi:hypothetical protein
MAWAKIDVPWLSIPRMSLSGSSCRMGRWSSSFQQYLVQDGSETTDDDYVLLWFPCDSDCQRGLL